MGFSPDPAGGAYVAPPSCQEREGQRRGKERMREGGMDRRILKRILESLGGVGLEGKSEVIGSFSPI